MLLQPLRFKNLSITYGNATVQVDAITKIKCYVVDAITKIKCYVVKML